MKKQFTITIEKETNPTAGYSAFCRELPGCHSNGRTINEALENMREAMVLHLGSRGVAGNPELFIEGATLPQLMKFLQGQCFVVWRKSNNHLTMIKTIYDGKKPIKNVMVTFPIHQAPDLGRKLTLQIMTEAGCNIADFLQGNRD